MENDRERVRLRSYQKFADGASDSQRQSVNEIEALGFR
jgi:hypothetical protein